MSGFNLVFMQLVTSHWLFKIGICHSCGHSPLSAEYKSQVTHYSHIQPV